MSLFPATSMSMPLLLAALAALGAALPTQSLFTASALTPHSQRAGHGPQAERHPHAAERLSRWGQRQQHYAVKGKVPATALEAIAVPPHASARRAARGAAKAAVSSKTKSPIKATPGKPNIVLFLTDDQDQVLGGSFPVRDGQPTPMPKTKLLMQDGGVNAVNFYAHSPICSPSRSELLTGRYFHNIKRTGGQGYCHGMHVDHEFVHENTFLRALKEEAGYTTGLFGKYVNSMPAEKPPGFDAWFANDGGSYIAPAFHVSGIKGLPDGEVRYNNAPGNYSTSVIGNVSIAWMSRAIKQGKPFMAYIAPKSAHEPFNPAPWYRDYWHPSWPETEPRPENWNCSAAARKHHHGNVKYMPHLSDRAAAAMTGIFKNRWRTLMSVDDLISDVIQMVDDLNQTHNTYFFFTSDHGFQLGQFNIPMDKRHVYEWDTKVHLLARGPGMLPNSRVTAPGTMVDLAPTLLSLVGLPFEEMDGRSMAPFFLKDYKNVPRAVLEHMKSFAPVAAYKQKWRTEVFIEYYFCNRNIKCFSVNCEARGNFPESDTFCADLENNSQCWCPTGGNCYTTETESNNFIALRRPGTSRNEAGWLYAEFEEGNQAHTDVNFTNINFREYFDLDKDPWHMHNLMSQKGKVSRKEQEVLSARLRRWLSCAGPTCF